MEIFKLFGSVFLEDQDVHKKLDGIDKKASGVGGTFGKVAGGIAKGGAMIAGAGVAAGSAVFAMANKTSDAMDRIDKGSQQLGMSAEAFQKWDFILSQTGGDIDSLGSGMKTLTNMTDDLKTGSKLATDTFGRLGMTYKDLEGLTQEEIFEKTVKALQNVEDVTERAALSNDLLGKQAMTLAPLFNAGAGAVDNYKEKAKELGIIIGEDTVKAGVDFKDTLDQLQRTVGGLLTQAIGPLIPIINDLMQELIKILPPLMAFIAPLIEKLTPVIQSLMDRLLPVFLKLLDSLLPIMDPIVDIFLLFVDDILVPLIDLLIPIIDELLPPLVELFNELLPIIRPILQVFMELVKSILPVFIDLFKMIFPIFKPLIELWGQWVEFILPLFTKSMQFITEKVLPPLMDILEKVFGTVGKVVDGVSNAVNKVKGVGGNISGGIKTGISKAKSFVKGIFGRKDIPEMDTGTNYVPEDMLAFVHKGEQVVPAAYNPALNKTITFDRGAFEGAMIMDDYGVDRLMDRISGRLKLSDARI